MNRPISFRYIPPIVPLYLIHKNPLPIRGTLPYKIDPLTAVFMRKTNSKCKRDDHILSYSNALAKTESESIKATVRKRKLSFEALATSMGEEHLPRRGIFGELVVGKYYSGRQKKGL